MSASACKSRVAGRELVNLCPHPVHLYEGDRCVAVVQPSGLARCAERREKVGDTYAGGYRVPVWRTVYGEVVGLPPELDGRLCIVSPIAALWMATHHPERHDLVVPDDLVRNEIGTVIGARALAQV